MATYSLQICEDELQVTTLLFWRVWCCLHLFAVCSERRRAKTIKTMDISVAIAMLWTASAPLEIALKPGQVLEGWS